MIIIKKEGVVLKRTALYFEDEGVLNPGVIHEGNDIHLLYRAVHKGNYSSIGYCKLEEKNPLLVTERLDTPVLSPQFEYESQGVEDPRIVKIDELYYVTYTAYNGVNAAGALALSKDLKHFEKCGLITPQINYRDFNCFLEGKPELIKRYALFNQSNDIVWDKNVIFFPRKINSKLFFLHRIKPDIQLVSAYNLQELTVAFWNNYFLHLEKNIVLMPKHKHEISYIGAGCPPIETEKGWLLIYHGVHNAASGHVYTACAALLNLENPLIEIARLPYPLFEPEHEWELRGEVNNVCFPTGTALISDTLYIYYGAADEQIACASVSLSALLAELLLNTDKNEK